MANPRDAFCNAQAGPHAGLRSGGSECRVLFLSPLADRSPAGNLMPGVLEWRVRPLGLQIVE